MPVSLTKAAGRSQGASLVASVVTPSSVTGTLVDTLLASLVIPAGTVRPGGALKLSQLYSFGAGTANNKRHRLVLGGVEVHNTLQTGNLCSSQEVTVRAISETSFVANTVASTTGFGHNAGAHNSGTINWNVDNTLEVRGQLAVDTDSITLLSLIVEALNQ